MFTFGLNTVRLTNLTVAMTITDNEDCRAEVMEYSSAMVMVYKAPLILLVPILACTLIVIHSFHLCISEYLRNSRKR